ncbi:hypothetical protein B0H16DRAFT_1469657 [Mycena metata]|uniref:Uncharacterized protein n=1 Tax=Mycena metata TaxID=1033252 RepID=A0AAD7HXG5_9AGAR|nr:hypothetical protein B0H16DRAFT_1469657 [Mycena metata]
MGQAKASRAWDGPDLGVVVDDVSETLLAIPGRCVMATSDQESAESFLRDFLKPTSSKPHFHIYVVFLSSVCTVSFRQLKFESGLVGGVRRVAEGPPSLPRSFAVSSVREEEWCRKEVVAGASARESYLVLSHPFGLILRLNELTARQITTQRNYRRPDASQGQQIPVSLLRAAYTHAGFSAAFAHCSDLSDHPIQLSFDFNFKLPLRHRSQTSLLLTAFECAHPGIPRATSVSQKTGGGEPENPGAEFVGKLGSDPFIKILTLGKDVPPIFKFIPRKVVKIPFWDIVGWEVPAIQHAIPVVLTI